MIFKVTWPMRSKMKKTILIIVVMALWPIVALTGLNEDLCIAAGRGNLPEVKRHLAKGTDVNRGVAKGWTTMMFASASGHREAVKELLAKGDEVNAQDNNGSGVQSSPSADDVITIKRPGEAYEVTTPLSRSTLIIPSDGLSQAEKTAGGATDNPRYFYFLDRKRGLSISGWFDPSQKFVEVRKQWAMDTSNWKRTGQPERLNPSFSIIGDWIRSPLIRFMWVASPRPISGHIGYELERGLTYISHLHLSV